MTAIEEVRKIPTTCPICKSKKEIDIPGSIISQASQLTTISLPKGLICDHHFQMFIDKNFKVRGYQKVDFEMKLGRIEQSVINRKKIIYENKSDDGLFHNLLLDGNYLEFKPKNYKKVEKNTQNVKERSAKKERMTLEDIYEEFWELIDDDNIEFEEFIIKDKRRVKHL